MVQTPLPPIPTPPLDINVLLDNLLPFLAGAMMIVAGVVVLRLLMRSSIGEAIAERIRARTRQRMGVSAGQDTGDMIALQDQVAQLEAHLTELTERVDFTERVLAKQRDPDRIGPAR